MQILLNGEELEVKLENEELLAEVLRDIVNWLESDSHCLKEFILDGKYYTLQDQPDGEWDFDLFQQELKQIEKLEIYSTPMQAYKQLELSQAHKCVISESENTVLESLKTLGDFFQLARSAFENQQFIFLQDFFSDSGALVELLQRIVTQVESSLWREDGPQHTEKNDSGTDENPLITELKDSLEQWQYFQNSQYNTEAVKQWHKDAIYDKKERMLTTFQGISSLIKNLHNGYEAWLSRPNQEPEKPLETVSNPQLKVEIAQATTLSDINVGELRDQLIHKIQQLEESFTQLQNGQVQDILYHVSELSLLLEQLLQQQELQYNYQIKKLFTQLGPFLKELSQAIETIDTVTFGDLIEYEIIPLLQRIIEQLN